MKEEWKTYTVNAGINKNHIIEVSNEGNVKDNAILIDFSKRHPTRYHQVHGLYVHRMVAELFVPNTEKKPFIDHINTDRLDNRAENLRWVTQTENMSNPLTRKKLKACWTEELRKSHAASVKRYADEHPEWKANISKTKKEYYSNPDNRKKQSERMKRAVQENENWGGSYLKGWKYMTDGAVEVFVSPEHWGEFIDIGFWFKNSIFNKLRQK